MNSKFKFFTTLLLVLVFSAISFSQNKNAGDIISVKIEGMHCASGCAMSIQKKLNNTDGILDANVDFSSSIALIEYDTSTDKNDIINLINEMKGGAYEASLISNDLSKKSCSKGKKCCKVTGKTNANCDQKSSGCCSSSKKECSSKKKK